MTALVAVEVRRFLARRLTRVMAGLAVLGILIGGTAAFAKHAARAPAPAGAISAPVFPEEFARCMRGEIGPPLGGAPGRQVSPAPGKVAPPPFADTERARAELCRSIAVSGQMTERDPRYHLADLQGTLKATSAVLVILAWVLGASFIGAEWHNRTITTLLTWEPRRIRVMLAKALACVLVAFCGALALQALLAGALTPAGVLRGTTEGMNAAWIRTTLGVGLRIAATSAIASVIGLSIAAVGRSAAAAMGTGFAYLVLFENLIGSLLPRWRPWLLISNAVVFVNGSDTFGIAGRGAVRAGVLLSAYAAGALVVATVLFLRRDVG